jgi:CheY-like chemotaxis protein
MSNKAILCVDDEQIILTSLRDQLLNHFGKRYIYEFAESVEEAWEVIEELDEEDIKIMVIVSDWLMPNIKGDEFLIKVHQKYPRIVKILLTGQADEEAIRRVQEQANLHGYLSKPWDEKALIEAIVKGLEGIPYRKNDPV